MSTWSGSGGINTRGKEEKKPSPLAQSIIAVRAKFQEKLGEDLRFVTYDGSNPDPTHGGTYRIGVNPAISNASLSEKAGLADGVNCTRTEHTPTKENLPASSIILAYESVVENLTGLKRPAREGGGPERR